MYWHLSEATSLNNYPVEILLLWNSDDYFWFTHIPPREERLVQQIQEGSRFCYLERFRLDYSEIQATFQEIRLVSYDQGHRLVITEGKEYTYKWSTTTWETTLENPDHSLINPRIHHLPPQQPANTQVLEVLEQEEALPPSSPPSTSDSVSGWGDTPNIWASTGVCWCNKEVCDCGYRPDTPPTPPSVVLWAPGQNYLPSF